MEITVYSTTYCPSCQSLKKWLDQKQIEYKAINLDDHPEEQAEVIQKTGSFLVPITIIKFDDGQEEIIQGPEYAQFKKVLNIE